MPGGPAPYPPRGGHVEGDEREESPELYVPRNLKLIQARPRLPPSLRPDGYDEGAPALPHAGHPDIPIEILPFLLLGTFKTASDPNLMTAMGVSALLNCCSQEFGDERNLARECMNPKP